MKRITVFFTILLAFTAFTGCSTPVIKPSIPATKFLQFSAPRDQASVAIALSNDPKKRSIQIEGQNGVTVVATQDWPNYSLVAEDIASLADMKAKANAYANSKTGGLRKAAKGESGVNVGITGFGLLAGIGAVVMTATNPLANAGWIAATSGLSTGALTFRSARGLEGFSSAAINEQFRSIQAEIKDAEDKFRAAEVDMRKSDTLKDYLTHYQEALNAIDRIVSVDSFEGIPQGTEQQNQAITTLTKTFQDSLTSIQKSIKDQKAAERDTLKSEALKQFNTAHDDVLKASREVREAQALVDKTKTDLDAANAASPPVPDAVKSTTQAHDNALTALKTKQEALEAASAKEKTANDIYDRFLQNEVDQAKLTPPKASGT